MSSGSSYFSPETTPLEPLGWNRSWEDSFAIHRGKGIFPARVAREEIGRYAVLDETGERIAENTGRLRHEASLGAILPAVGDWVVLRRREDGPSTILAVLPRRTAFLRKVPGETTEEQVIAANVDTVFLVSGLDDDFNVRRIERYLTAAWESGAAPVIVLNKADLSGDLAAQVEEVERIAFGVPIIPVSALSDLDGGVFPSAGEALAPWLLSGVTIALLGSSGVGKSTLVNALLGVHRQDTGAVRSADSKGKHTTTRRELIALPGGALLMDTPGMRELQLWGDEKGLDEAFPEVTAFAEACRFRDCTHKTEPGCAVQAAIQSGELEIDRLAAWEKLQRELAHLERRRDARAMSTERAKWKQRSRNAREHAKTKRSSRG